jgi:hypothetical protein
VSGRELPSIASIVGSVLERVAAPQRPLFIALAERLAAERYRGWAANASGPARRDLLACAAREDAIADRVAALYADAAALQQRLRADHPELDEVNEAIFAGRPLAEQFAIQAAGERAGAAAWRAFAAQTGDPEARATFLACAELEEQSATYLESILAGG